MPNIPYSPVRRHAARLALLICCLVFAGCGQKGDLYLPETPRQSPDSAAEGAR